MEILADLSPETIPAAMVANRLAYGAFFGAAPGGAWHDEPGIAWFETGVPLDLLNGVARTQLDPGESPAAIARVLARFQRRRLPLHWRIGPTCRPNDLGARLRARGIAHIEDEPGMAADLAAVHSDLPLSTRLSIAPVATDAQLDAWMRMWGCGAPDAVIALRLGAYRGLGLGLGPRSPLRLYLGTLEGEPVATAALFLGGGVAAIEDVVTRPDMRRRGIGAGMMLAATRAARAAGYRVGVLTASPMGIALYRRLGFCEHGVWSTYAWQPADVPADLPGEWSDE